VLAVKMVQSSNWPAGTKAEESESERIAEAERYLLARSGYGRNPELNPEPCVVLCRMECAGVDRNASYDSHAWGGRTFPVAHNYIIENFDALNSGDVIDVEFILGETTTKKLSERLTAHL